MRDCSTHGLHFPAVHIKLNLLMIQALGTSPGFVFIDIVSIRFIRIFQGLI